jgi:ribose transport system permease protein
MPAVVGPLLILIGLCVIITLITPRFLSPTNLAGVARQTSILLISALGVSLVIMMGGIDLSIEGVMALSSVIASLLVASVKPETGALQFPPKFNVGFLAVVVAVGVATLMGLLNGVLHTKLRIPSFMVTLGMLSVGVGLATWLSRIGGTATDGDGGLSPGPPTSGPGIVTGPVSRGTGDVSIRCRPDPWLHWRRLALPPVMPIP